MHNKITRRKFIEGTVFIASAIGAMAILGDSGKVVMGKQTRNEKFIRRRKEDSNRWFKPREYVLVGSLAALIIPSDETGPGALDAEVVNTIDDSMVSKSQYQQTLYTKGLNAFDEAARHKYNLTFVKLTQDQQIDLLKLVDRAHEELELSDYSLLNRINRKFKYYKYTKWDGLGATIDMFPILVKDVMQAFYTSQVAWDWLGYDGPPQPFGYIGKVSKCVQS